jgi:hypothetical protein
MHLKLEHIFRKILFLCRETQGKTNYHMYGLNQEGPLLSLLTKTSKKRQFRFMPSVIKQLLPDSPTHCHSPNAFLLEERNWLGLELIRVTAKLNFFMFVSCKTSIFWLFSYSHTTDCLL